MEEDLKRDIERKEQDERTSGCTQRWTVSTKSRRRKCG